MTVEHKEDGHDVWEQVLNVLFCIECEVRPRVPDLWAQVEQLEGDSYCYGYLEEKKL